MFNHGVWDSENKVRAQGRKTDKLQKRHANTGPEGPGLGRGGPRPRHGQGQIPEATPGQAARRARPGKGTQGRATEKTRSDHVSK